MNKTVLIGRSTKDADVRYSQGDKPMAIARISLAVDRKFKQEGQPTADFINCIAFGKTAEVIEKYVTKGTKIAVVGHIQTGSYTNKDGQKVYTTDVVIDELEFCESRSSNSPCMIVFCSFEQLPTLIDAGKKHGFNNYIPLVFIKNYSPQVLKANMRVVGATEYALVLYRDRLPKFRNGVQIDENGKNIRGTGKMIFNWFDWQKDGKEIPKIHPSQKPVAVLKKLIEIFTDEGDVVIDPCCGSGSTLRAAAELGRSAYGFEIDRNFYEKAKNEMLVFDKDEQLSIFDI